MAATSYHYGFGAIGQAGLGQSDFALPETILYDKWGFAWSEPLRIPPNVFTKARGHLLVDDQPFFYWDPGLFGISPVSDIVSPTLSKRYRMVEY